MADLRASGLGGTPFGGTADRPSSPSKGQTFYNGDLGILEIYTGTEWVASSAPASVPINVVATNTASSRAFNNGRASVAFSNGSGGGLVFDFIVTPSPATSPATFTGSSSPIIVTGLQSSQQYTYTVQARNNFGTSLSSAASAAVTATTVPQNPTIGTPSVTGASGEISVPFTANATGGSAITSYTVTSSPGNITASGASSPIIVTGLTNGTAYTFTVTATNANGTSAASSASSSATPKDLSVSYLVVAGGGGGGSHIGGGGGGGGVRAGTIQGSPGTTYNISVGGGGVGAIDTTGLNGTNGTNSSFGSITATGGGKGGSGNQNGFSGGSGGGSAHGPGSGTGGSGNAGSYTPVEGYAGGNGTQAGAHAGGGGGGAGGAGGNGSSSGIGGAGGIGIQNSILGTNYYWAGGGGGTTGIGQTNLTAGSGGLGGGGGASIENSPNTPGSGGGSALNTGGNGSAGGSPAPKAGNGGQYTGGGGGGGSHASGDGGEGGSGIVIVSLNEAASAVTGSPTLTNPGGKYVYRFNNSGSITV